MALVRLKLNVAVGRWAAGEIVDTERTPRVAGLIENGYATVLQDVVPDVDADGGPAFPDSVQLTADQAAALGTGILAPDDFTRLHLAETGIDPAAPMVPYRDATEDTAAAAGAGASSHGVLSAAVAQVPPRTGKGSGEEVWRKFLTGQGVDTAEYPDRAALIAAWDTITHNRDQ